MKVAIVTRPDYKSPRILAESLLAQLYSNDFEAEIFYNIDTLTRLVSFKNSGLSFHFWLRRRIKNLIQDIKFIRKLREYDIIVICECTPNGFWKNLYNIEELKRKTQIPVLFYEVYFLGNAPTMVKKLNQTGNSGIELYDWHLSVSKVTEICNEPQYPWSSIGIYSKSWGIFPNEKDELIAIVDFVQEGYEHYREAQINALIKAKIKFISLEKKYSIHEIRKIYQSASIFFIQFPEAFGLSILECLCAGAQIFTPHSGWPMAFRINKNAKFNGPGILPDCFTVYEEVRLVETLIEFKNNFHKKKSPQKVFETFYKFYPEYYEGDSSQFLYVLNNYKKLLKF